MREVNAQYRDRATNPTERCEYLSACRYYALTRYGLSGSPTWSSQVDSCEELRNLDSVQWTGATGAQIAEPDRPDGRPDQPLNRMVDSGKQPTDDVIATLM